MATPIDAATKRLGSFVDDSAMTANTTCPGFISDSPSSRSTSSQCGGKIELTRTRLKFARWASRNAISKLVSFSLCRPTPLVRKALVGTNIRDSINRSPPVSLHTTPPAPPLPAAPDLPSARRRCASRARSPPPATAPSPPPRYATDPAPCRARRACSVPCRRATGHRLQPPGTPPPPFPTPGLRASTAGTGRSSRSRTARPAARRLRRVLPTPAHDPALAENGRRRLRLLPSLHVESQHVHEVLGVGHDAVRLMRPPVPQLVHDELRLIDAYRRQRPQLLRLGCVHERRQHVADRDRMQRRRHEHRQRRLRRPGA